MKFSLYLPFPLQSRLSAIVFNGNAASADEEKKRDAAVSIIGAGSDGKRTPSLPIFRALKEDAVRGGCILSAGELDSSKEYLQQQDGSWIVAYQVEYRPRCIAAWRILSIVTACQLAPLSNTDDTRFTLSRWLLFVCAAACGRWLSVPPGGSEGRQRSHLWRGSP